MFNSKKLPFIKWEIERFETSIGGDGIRVVAQDGRIVCDNEPYYPKAIAESDAVLIAEAPNLLQCLRDLVQILEWHGDAKFLNEDAGDGNKNALSIAREVIAKAEGNLK